MEFAMKQSIIRNTASQFKSVEPMSFKSVNSPSSFKINSNTQTIVVKNPLEQVELVNSLIWRQKTNMPILKVLNFRSDMSDYGYPKNYHIEIESVGRPIVFLKNLQLKSALYLIQQCISGIQALTCKYSTFDLNQLFFCLNDKGECKTWLTKNIIDYKPSDIALPSQDLIINYVIKKIQYVCNSHCKQELEKLIFQVRNNRNISLTDMHVLLNKFAKANNISLYEPCISQSQFLGVSHVQQKKEEIRCQQSTISKNSTPTKVNFRYQSPISKTVQNSRASSFNGKFSIIRKQCNSKPKVSWNYQVFPQSRSVNTSRINSLEKSYCEVKNSQCKIATMSNMLQNSQILKNKLKQSKNQFCGILTSQNNYNNAINNIKIDESYIKTCTSIVFPSQNCITNKSIVLDQCHEYENWNKNSFSTTHQSNNTCSNYSIIVNQPKHKTHHQITNQNINPSHLQSRPASHHANEYNFGGLIPLPQKSMKQSQQIQDPQLQFEMFDIRNRSKSTAPSPMKKSEYVLKSLIINHPQFKQNSHFDWDWSKKFVNYNLLEEDKSSLKQSLYCGEEKKPQPLPIKLDLLGKFGRQITTSSFIPQNYDF